MPLFRGTLTAFGILLLFSLRAYGVGDVRPQAVTVYFEKDGEPYDEPVDFTLNCYDCSTVPSVNIYSLSATCPSYGCEVIMPTYFSTGTFGECTRCDCEGETEGEEFIIEDYDSFPFRCKIESFEPWVMHCELRLDIGDEDGDGGGGCLIDTVENSLRR